MNVTELHLHDFYSALDGYPSPSEYMARAKELGMTHLAQTNHGTLIGHREFQRAAKEAGIIPILGVEAYISATDRFDRRSNAKRTDGTSTYNHIILLAQNETGLKTLYRINEIAHTEGFYSKPRLDLDALEEHNDGIIVLSGCLNSLLCKAIEAGDMDGAMRTAHRLKSIFRDRFFIEVQAHNPVEMNQALLSIADSMNIKPVATSDCHYSRKEDLWVEEAMLILSTKPDYNKGFEFSKSQKMDMLERFNYLYPDRKMTFQKIEVYLRSVEEQRAGFAKQGIEREDIFANTNEIAQSIGEYPFYKGLDLLPTPKNDSPDALLEKKAWAGLRNRGLDQKPEYVDRLREELDIIKSKKFSTYFLIVSNMISWAKSKGIMVGPGRGSGAGSLVNYALGITDVDPIKYGLLFFRFVDPSRDDFPDVDTDFEDRRRGEVQGYLRRQFKHVGNILTVTKYQGKNALRDAARVFRVPEAEVSKASKNIDAPPDKPEIFWKMFEQSTQGKEFAKKYPEVIRLAENLQGRPKSVGMHAAGIVMAKEPIAKFAPIESAKDPNDKAGPRRSVVALDMNDAAEVGFVKLDVLGLKTLTVIHDALEEIKKRTGKEIDLLNLSLDDKSVYQMLSDGYTTGVFQCEAAPYTNLIIRMGGVWSFAELAASNALVRPGAMNTIGAEYIARKNGKSDVSYVHEDMRWFTEDTYGEILYQEQVMLTITEVAGMSMGEANKVRKIIGKKKDVKEFDAFRDRFVEGASKKIPKATAERLWHDFEAHAGYSFNKSHAVAYSMISYWTAWLKRYYPLEFMCAVLRNEEDKDKRTEYLIETKRLGIKVLLPHVNVSETEFSIEGDSIRFGLSAIKFISSISANKLIEYRPYANYKHLEDKVFQKNSGLNSRMLGALNAIGAAAFPDHPRTGQERDNFYTYLAIPEFAGKDLPPKVKAQFRPLDEFSETGCFVVSGMVKKIKSGKGWSRIEIVDETGTAGIFDSEYTMIEPGHMYAILVADNRVARFAPLSEVEPDSNNTFVQYLFTESYPDLTDNFYRVVASQTHTTKAGKKMMYLVLCDEHKEMSRVLAFPQMFHSAYSKCREGATVGAEFGVTDDGTVFLKELY